MECNKWISIISNSSSNTSGVTGVTAGASATLRWTVSNGTCTAATDDVVLTNNSNPTAVITNNTGSTELTCATTSISVTQVEVVHIVGIV